ncbi:MAG: hypothetical protein IPK68_16225 [Bdellovibrionales bacterium]|nr:hypothetical protein [Bdellovibrionales bacterium]
MLLANVMNDQMLAMDSSGRNMKVVLRTDPTNSPTNQSQKKVRIAVPARVSRTQSSGQSGID